MRQKWSTRIGARKGDPETQGGNSNHCALKGQSCTGQGRNLG